MKTMRGSDIFKVNYSLSDATLLNSDTYSGFDYVLEQMDSFCEGLNDGDLSLGNFPWNIAGIAYQVSPKREVFATRL